MQVMVMRVRMPSAPRRPVSSRLLSGPRPHRSAEMAAQPRRTASYQTPQQFAVTRAGIVARAPSSLTHNERDSETVKTFARAARLPVIPPDSTE